MCARWTPNFNLPRKRIQHSLAHPDIYTKNDYTFIHSGDLYNASSRDYYSEAIPAQSRTKRRTSERCKIWKGGPSVRNAAQRGDHSMLMDPQPKRLFAA